MANLAVIVIILATTAFQYTKGRLLRACATLIITIIAAAIAFTYFEPLANVFISRGGDTRYPAMLPWAMPLSFTLLFVIAFSIFQAVASQVMKIKVDLGTIDKAGRSVCGFFLGLVLAGLLLTVLTMSPLHSDYPYQRFDRSRPNLDQPNTPLFNPDGLVTGWYSVMSTGSMSTGKSFAVVRANFLDQMYLNRMAANNVSTVTTEQVLRAEDQWEAYDLQDIDPAPTGQRIMVARIAISSAAAADGDLRFTPAQIRLVCNTAVEPDERLAGSGHPVYPVGYIHEQNRVRAVDPLEIISLSRDDFEDRYRQIDFLFYVPEDMTPVLAQFKANNIDSLSSPAAADEIPSPVFFDHQARQRDAQDDIEDEENAADF